MARSPRNTINQENASRWRTLAEKISDKLPEMSDKFISAATALLSIFLILYSSYVLYDTFYTQNKAFGAQDAAQFKPVIIEETGTPLSSVSLKDINEDYRMWLSIDDTTIDYPVMQGKDDLYYAAHDIYNEISLTGAIYLSAGSAADLSDNYSIIYGHHMDNGAMFGNLDLFMDEDYFNNHILGTIITDSGEVYDMKLFAVLETDAYESMVYTTGNRDLAELVDYLRRNCMIYNGNFDGKLVPDKVVALSTCRDAETSGRLVIFAYLVKRDTPVPPPGPEPEPEPTPPGPEPEPIPPGKTPTSSPKTFGFASNFQPTGNAYGRRAWALVNLICLICTWYLFIPLLDLKAKYRRGKLMDKYNEDRFGLKELEEDEAGERDIFEKGILEWIADEIKKRDNRENEDAEEDDYKDAVEELYYGKKRFSRRFWSGEGLELIDAVAALIAFILTEDMRLPMILIDRWTPLMIFFLLVAWVLDVRLIRYREGFEMEDIENEEEEDIV